MAKLSCVFPQIATETCKHQQQCKASLWYNYSKYIYRTPSQKQVIQYMHTNSTTKTLGTVTVNTLAITHGNHFEYLWVARDRHDWSSRNSASQSIESNLLTSDIRLLIDWLVECLDDQSYPWESEDSNKERCTPSGPGCILSNLLMQAWANLHKHSRQVQWTAMPILSATVAKQACCSPSGPCVGVFVETPIRCQHTIVEMRVLMHCRGNAGSWCRRFRDSTEMPAMTATVEMLVQCTIMEVLALTHCHTCWHQDTSLYNKYKLTGKVNVPKDNMYSLPDWDRLLIRIVHRLWNYPYTVSTDIEPSWYHWS